MPRTHHLFRPKCMSIPLGHSDGQIKSLELGYRFNVNYFWNYFANCFQICDLQRQANQLRRRPTISQRYERQDGSNRGRFARWRRRRDHPSGDHERRQVVLRLHNDPTAKSLLRSSWFYSEILGHSWQSRADSGSNTVRKPSLQGAHKGLFHFVVQCTCHPSSITIRHSTPSLNQFCSSYHFHSLLPIHFPPG